MRLLLGIHASRVKSLDLRVSSVILAHFPVGLHENPFPKDFWPVSPLIFVKYAYIRLKLVKKLTQTSYFSQHFYSRTSS